MFNTYFSRVLLLMLGACLSMGFSANLLAGHAWGTYHWERAENPVYLTLGDNFSDNSWDEAYYAAVADWNSSSVLSLTKVAGTTNARRCKAVNGTIEICAKRYGNTGWLGLAGISVSGGHITKAYAKMNDTYYELGGFYDTPAWRALVMCQEIGHAFGLGHQDEGFNNGNLNTCMDYTNDPDSNQHPNSHDYSMLESIYNHLESADSDSGGGDCNPRNPNCRPNANIPSFVSDMEFQGPGPDPQWGNLVQRSMDGHQEVYVLDLGRGNKVITHVTWVESRNRSHHD